jgi:7-cyano-7-deazaguanine synthase
MKKVVLILSGGMDSSTLLYKYIKDGYLVKCISFDYGQKHKIELQYASKLAILHNLEHKIIDVSFMKDILTKSSLINNDINIPHGEYSKYNMLSTVVPNRNTILLSIAWAFACNEDADILAYGAQSGDHYLYPDTRMDYFLAMNLALRLGTEDCRVDNLQLEAPLICLHKHEVLQLGLKYGVDYSLTYSCYEGNEIHCGKCGACQSRKKAFLQLNLLDPTKYIV